VAVVNPRSSVSGSRLLLGELVVIVAGILIALAADSRWQNRLDSQREREYLEAFRSDVEQTIATNAAVARDQDSIQGAMERIAVQIACRRSAVAGYHPARLPDRAYSV
jgi:hypothetical protein